MKDAWISVEERLPEPMQPVLVHHERGMIKVEDHFRNGRWMFDDLYGHVTHWQPLEPPEGVFTDG